MTWRCPLRLVESEEAYPREGTVAPFPESPARTTVELGAIVTDKREAVAAAYVLVADLADMGAHQPHVLTPDGDIQTGRLNADYRQQLTRWTAQSNAADRATARDPGPRQARGPVGERPEDVSVVVPFGRRSVLLDQVAGAGAALVHRLVALVIGAVPAGALPGRQAWGGAGGRSAPAGRRP